MSKEPSREPGGVVDLAESAEAQTVTTQGDPPSPAPGSVASAKARRRAGAAGRASWTKTALPGDVCATALALSLSGLFTESLYRSFSASEYTLYTLAIGVGWLGALAFGGAYETRVELFGVEELRRVLRAAVTLLALVAIPHFVFELDVSQRYTAIALAALFVTTMLWRTVLRWSIASSQARGQDQYRSLLCGSYDDVMNLVSHLARQKQPLISVEQVCISNEAAPGQTGLPEGVLAVDDIYGSECLDPASLDLVVRVGQPDPDELWRLTELAHSMGLPLSIAPQRHDVANVDFGYLPVNGTPLLMIETPAQRLLHRATKAIVDRVAAAVLIGVLSPVLVGVSLLIAMLDSRPVLYRQTRVGRDGKQFEILKYRTMVPDAHDMVPMIETMNQSDGPLFKVRDDPRVTRVGHVLRRYSLDELPQLWNVLRGEMSLVGPRPPLPEEVVTYDSRTARRLVVKPGITGLWQVEGRADLSWEEGLYYDLYYVNHWSPVLDISIVIRTLGAVIRRTGAY